ncbi:multidrug effflux MFS transporter [Pseudomonas profundi]|uniref:multidrug effflux MFS transporter n=1 Tax=Pseudomonas profundi TaxID=1981513 RepID=UPI00123C47B7|nr:multidrug effflux MFS transporter [Pseudomonas profundi]
MPLKILLILGGLSAFGPLAIDLYLPAFPAMAEAFATDSEHIQLSLSAYFLGLALGQLFYGPIADRFGRRKPLLFGIGLFCAASLACALAPTLEWLIVARFAQALGGCAGIVVNRAVVRDLCEPIEAAKAFSQLMLVMGVAPILAPLAGGWLLALGNWTWIFLFLTLFSAVFSFAVFFGLKETLPPTVTPPALSSALGRYRRLLGEPLFMFHALTGGIAMAGMFAYIAGSPFLIIELYGISAAHFGWFFAINASGFILFAQINSWFLRRHPPMKLLRFTTLFFAVCNVLLLTVAIYQPMSLWPFLLPLFGSVAVIALVLPNSSAEAMAGQGHQAGVASALMGTMQFVIAGITSALVGILHDGTAVPMTAVMATCGIGSLVMARLAQRATVKKAQAALAN